MCEMVEDLDILRKCLAQNTYVCIEEKYFLSFECFIFIFKIAILTLSQKHYFDYKIFLKRLFKI